MIFKSKVYLVGGGPGDIELLTIRALRLIQHADVILYDALIGEEVLREAKEDALLHYVGKRAGRHSYKQEEINQLIHEYAQKSKLVVRLKGGDPFIFGRGFEEMEYLKQRGVSVEAVPGISSAVSLPLLQNVPLTHRGIADGFWVITGTKEDSLLSKDIFDAVKTTATLVILMAIKKLPLIRSILIREGRLNLPIMIIENGSRSNEKVIIGTVENILSLARENKLATPGIIVIGEVVRYAKPEEFVNSLSFAI